MSNTLTKNDITALGYLTLVENSMRRRSQLFDQGKLTFNQALIISEDETRFLNKANRAANLIIDSIATDISNPGKVLQDITKELENVIKEIEDFNDIIAVFSLLIRLFGRILVATSSGPLAIAQIGPIIDDIRQLVNSRNSQ